ncbi:hypothetical protein LINGRAPRIM_LOCUS176 [Linum grandiflorum]
MTLLQSWIYEYFPSLRGADSPASQDVGAPLAGRWDGVRLGGQSGEAGQQRLYMLCDRLDRLTHAHVEWLPYGSSPVSSGDLLGGFGGILGCSQWDFICFFRDYRLSWHLLRVSFNCGATSERYVA